MGTLTLRPNGAGTFTNIITQFPATGAHWDKVDEETADEDTTYLEEVVSSTNYDSYALPASGLSGWVIESITVYVRGKNSAGAGVGRRLDPTLYTYGAIYWEDTGQPTTSYANNSTVWTTNPDTGIAWTWTEIDALEIGVRIGTGTGGDWVRCTQVWVEIAYTGTVFPSDPQTRVTSLIHRYDRGTYTLEVLLGEVTADFGVPEWLSKPRSSLPSSRIEEIIGLLQGTKLSSEERLGLEVELEFFL